MRSLLSLLQDEQTKCPQPLLIRLLLQTLHPCNSMICASLQGGQCLLLPSDGMGGSRVGYPFPSLSGGVQHWRLPPGSSPALLPHSGPLLPPLLCSGVSAMSPPEPQKQLAVSYQVSMSHTGCWLTEDGASVMP